MRRRDHRNSRVQADFEAHGIESFVFEVLEYADKGSLKTAEQRLLDQGGFAYNFAKSATGGHGGFTHSSESREKIRQSRIGTKQTDESRRRQSQTRRAMKMTGSDSCRFGGYFHTPWGKFGSSYQASENGLVTQPSIIKWCKNADNTISSKSFGKSPYLQSIGKSVIGKTPRQLGFSFQPV